MSHKDLERRLARIEKAARQGIGYLRIECSRTETDAEALRRVFGDAGPPAGVPVICFEAEPTAGEWEAEANAGATPLSDELEQDRAGRRAFMHIPGPCRVIRIAETEGAAS